MMSPSPPPPAIAAIVAVAITKTAAMRMPAKISGAASGSSTAQQDLPPGHPHPPRGLDDVPVDLVDPEVGVRQDRRDAEDDERDRVVPEEVVGDEQEEGDQDEARQRAADVRDADREERAAVVVAEDDPERQCDQRSRSRARRRRARGAATVLSQSRCGWSTMKRIASGNVPQLKVSARRRITRASTGSARGRRG